MRTPRFLLGAALLFWGWQTGFLEFSAIMAIVLESWRWVRIRWDFSDDDFSRIWTFCGLLLLAAGAYAFTSNGGPSEVRNFLSDPRFMGQHNAGNATSKAAAAWFRWLPMIFFLFVAAETYSTRQGIPLEVISLILRRRWQRARRLGQPLPPTRTVSVTYPYFGACLFSSSIQVSGGAAFFWGLCALVVWALWFQRSRRFAVTSWVAALAAALVLGYAGQRGIGSLVRLIDDFNPQIHPEWLEWLGRSGGFDPEQSKTALGQIGRVKASGKIVVRLETVDGAPPSLLRVASYRSFGSGQAWYSEVRKEDFQPVLEAAADSYVLLPGKTNRAKVNIACYLSGRSGLLPVPAGCGRLDNFYWLESLEKSELGALLATGPGLAVFDASFGPGATIDAPPVTNLDLAVPDREDQAVSQVVADLGLKGQSLDEALRTLSRFFIDKFSYTTWQGPASLRPGETPLSRFLLSTRSGHCEYFATATVLLLRQAGFAARYAVGYAVHEGTAKKLVVRQRDAHAWTLVWDDKARIWRDFDTTPASWIEAEDKRASPFQLLADAWSRFTFELSRIRWGQTNLRQYTLWALGPVLAVLLYQIIWRSRKQRRHGKPSAGGTAVVWPGLDSEFYQLERRLEARGVARRPSEPLAEWLRRAVGEPGLEESSRALQALLRLHYRYRFDPRGLETAERERLRRDASACLRQMNELSR